MFQALLAIPFALAIVFFTISYFQRDKVIAAANKLTKDKKVKEVVKQTKKAINKAAKQVTAKVAKVVEQVEQQEKVIKNLVEEIDITEYASIQSKSNTVSAPVKEEKKEEKKQEKKQEVKVEENTIASPSEEGKKKKKKAKTSEWQTQPSTYRPPKEEPVQEEKTEDKPSEPSSDDNKPSTGRGSSRGGRGVAGAARGGRGRGRGASDNQPQGEKSIYKQFKPAVPVVEEVKEEIKKEEVPVEEEKKKLPSKPFVKMVPAYKAYSDPEDFWNTDLSKTYKEPVEEEVVAPVAAPVEESSISSPVTEESILSINDDKSSSKAPKASKSRQQPVAPQQPLFDENTTPATIKVNNSASLARTDPWAQNDNSQVVASSEIKESFPALGEKVTKKKKAPQVKKVAKEASPVAEEKSEDVKNSHKREATNTLFEYEADAPSDKKIKLEEETVQESNDETL
ncbi:hypothetical protein AKO1_000311 [Acrasis kona]|uniref:Uncharacterized protein n=1 Tax=Acrasis kona TaxID=1008807 RepID=A0AAW2ZDW0_9EUKA